MYLADLFGTSNSRIRGRAELHGGVGVYQPVLDPVEHPKPVVEPTLFEAVPFEILMHAGDFGRLLFCIVVAGIPCRLPLHLFKGLDILLPVLVPNTQAYSNVGWTMVV